ncbi:hypothetical protein LCGC14_2814710 [marine sediment metagenome]|uniref:Uncharacterized protein n=1 Tax=marine sediment metagenome TaxID=412755 RepID=A0A0F8YIU4_9ZZZZ
MDKSIIRILGIISLFAIAMGLLESAVVIYLRDILYPGGFEFPLNPVRPDLVWTEILRELATLVMLLTIGILAGKTAPEKFAWFLYTFAIWDIFYYVFLWALIGWPESFMTWDVLFLLPVTWTGPVISPLIIASTMILLALLIVRKESGRIPKLSWILLISGSLILITAFTWDYSGFVLEKMSFRDIWTLPGSQVHAMVHEYIPRKFNWLLFSLGELVILSGIYVYWKNPS